MTLRGLDPVPRDGGRTLAVSEVGDPAGETAFYFHGTGSSRLEIGLYERAATDRGIRLIGWDRPGSGDSPAQPDRTLLDVVADARAVAERFGVDRVPVIGLSGGGSHVLALAATAPDLVRRGIAINPGPPSDDAVLARLSPQVGRPIALARDHPRIFRVLSQVLQFRGGGRLGERLRTRNLDPRDREVLSRPEVGPLFRAAADLGARQPRAFTTEALIIWNRPWGFPLDTFPVPLDVFTGTEDLFRPFCEQLAGDGATLHVFSGGHVSGFVPEVMDEVVAIADGPAD